MNKKIIVSVVMSLLFLVSSSFNSVYANGITGNLKPNLQEKGLTNYSITLEERKEYLEKNEMWLSEEEYLKEAIRIIDSVLPDDRKMYLEKNGEWIKYVGLKLDDYLSKFPEEQRNTKLDNLYKELENADSSSNVMYSLKGKLGVYFTNVWYHTRGGYKTYSMYPKWSVRVWTSTMKAGWSELKRNYSGIRNDNGSMWRQYKCHFDYDVAGALAGSWDLEVGRPIVSEAKMIATRCNPK